MTEPTTPIRIFVDADACPVKDEVFRVALRYGLQVYLVANAPLRVPKNPLFESVVVARGIFDGADDWIVDRVTPTDIAVTADIPLAARCLERVPGPWMPRGGSTPPSPSGTPWPAGSSWPTCGPWGTWAEARPPSHPGTVPHFSSVWTTSFRPSGVPHGRLVQRQEWVQPS